MKSTTKGADMNRYAEVTRDEVPAHSFRYGQRASVFEFDVDSDAYAVCTTAAHENDDRTFSDVLVAHFLFTDEARARSTAASLSREGADNGPVTLVHPKGVFLSIPYFRVRYENAVTRAPVETCVMSEPKAREFADVLNARGLNAETIEVGRR